MTFDRSYKKDAFYAYKAWLSDEPFVHVCGKRYVDRVEDTTKVTVYSNLPEVELLVNGESIGKIKAADHFFYFQVPNVGETTITAIAGDCRDESHIRKVDTFNEAYLLKEKGAILNWFDVTTREGYFCLNDTMGELMKTLRGKLVLLEFAGIIMRSMKKNQKEGKKGSMGGNAKMKMDSNVMKMLDGFTILRASSMIGMVGATVTKEQLLRINRQLNRIKKPTK
jgi:beta-galactosidase